LDNGGTQNEGGTAQPTDDKGSDKLDNGGTQNEGGTAQPTDDKGSGEVDSMNQMAQCELGDEVGAQSSDKLDNGNGDTQIQAAQARRQAAARAATSWTTAASNMKAAARHTPSSAMTRASARRAATIWATAATTLPRAARTRGAGPATTATTTRVPFPASPNPTLSSHPPKLPKASALPLHTVSSQPPHVKGLPIALSQGRRPRADGCGIEPKRANKSFGNLSAYMFMHSGTYVLQN
jgi:hypothetical protein